VQNKPGPCIIIFSLSSGHDSEGPWLSHRSFLSCIQFDVALKFPAKLHRTGYMFLCHQLHAWMSICIATLKIIYSNYKLYSVELIVPGFLPIKKSAQTRCLVSNFACGVCANCLGSFSKIVDVLSFHSQLYM